MSEENHSPLWQIHEKDKHFDLIPVGIDNNLRKIIYEEYKDVNLEKLLENDNLMSKLRKKVNSYEKQIINNRPHEKERINREKYDHFLRKSISQKIITHSFISKETAELLVNLGRTEIDTSQMICEKFPICMITYEGGIYFSSNLEFPKSQQKDYTFNIRGTKYMKFDDFFNLSLSFSDIWLFFWVITIIVDWEVRELFNLNH